jgi:hypothetical protein
MAEESKTQSPLELNCSDNGWQNRLFEHFDAGGEVAVVTLSPEAGFDPKAALVRTGVNKGPLEGDQIDAFWPAAKGNATTPLLAELYDICENAYGSSEFSVGPQAPQYTASQPSFDVGDTVHIYMGPLPEKESGSKYNPIAVIHNSSASNEKYIFMYLPDSQTLHAMKRAEILKDTSYDGSEFTKLEGVIPETLATVQVQPGQVLVIRLDIVHCVPKPEKGSFVVMHSPRPLLDADYLFATKESGLFGNDVTNFEAELMGMPFGIPGFVGDLGGMRPGDYPELPVETLEGGNEVAFGAYEKHIRGRINEIASRIHAKEEGYTLPRRELDLGKGWGVGDMKKEDALSRLENESALMANRIVRFWEDNWSKRAVDVDMYFKAGWAGAMYNLQIAPLSTQERKELKDEGDLINLYPPKV